MPVSPTPTSDTAPATTGTSPVRISVISGVIGGVIGAVMSGLVNYVVIGMPDSEGANALNHVISGLISGFIAGFAGLLAHQRKTAAAARAGDGTSAG